MARNGGEGVDVETDEDVRAPVTFLCQERGCDFEPTTDVAMAVDHEQETGHHVTGSMRTGPIRRWPLARPASRRPVQSLDISPRGDDERPGLAWARFWNDPRAVRRERRPLALARRP